MKVKNLYLKYILPNLIKFDRCDIYNYEIKNIEQQLAESLNKKNIHEALDIPDFRHVKDLKLQSYIIELACKKLKIGKSTEYRKNSKSTSLIIDDIEYQLILFPMGAIPEIELINQKVIFMMYEPGFKKIFYCGKIELNRKITKKIYSEFYEKHCESGNKLFTDFNVLIK